MTLEQAQAELRAVTAEKELADAKITTLETENAELKAENAKVKWYKADAEFAREIALKEFRNQFVAHKDGVTDEDADKMRDAVGVLPLTEIYDKTETYRVLADARFEAQRQSEAEPGKPEGEEAPPPEASNGKVRGNARI